MLYTNQFDANDENPDSPPLRRTKENAVLKLFCLSFAAVSQRTGVGCLLGFPLSEIVDVK